jgi:UrcA family protein
MISTKLCVLAALGAMLVTPAAAQVKVGPETYAFTLVNLDTRPKTVSAARRTLARIDEAALAVCGAPRGSLREVRRAARKAACWKDSVDHAIAAIGDPLLTRVHQHGQ